MSKEYKPFKMKGHSLPGINQKSEGNTDTPEGRSKSSAFQYKESSEEVTKKGIKRDISNIKRKFKHFGKDIKKGAKLGSTETEWWLSEEGDLERGKPYKIAKEKEKRRKQKQKTEEARKKEGEKQRKIKSLQVTKSTKDDESLYVE